MILGENIVSMLSVSLREKTNIAYRHPLSSKKVKLLCRPKISNINIQWKCLVSVVIFFRVTTQPILSKTDCVKIPVFP